MSDLAYSTQGFSWHVTSVNGISHVWWEMGEGEPCVYFHGGGTFHGFDWARDWAGKFRMIVPHHPNFGESQDAAKVVSVDDYVAHYQAFFAAIGLTRFHLVGASMGGHLAVTYAARNQDQIGRLILAAPGGLRSARAPMPNWAATPLAEQSALFAGNPDWVARYWPKEPDADWLALRQREAGASQRAQADPDIYPKLQRSLATLKRPTLLLWGEKDRVLGLPLLEEWQKALPHAQSAVIPGGSHLLLDEFPAARQAGLAFLSS